MNKKILKLNLLGLRCPIPVLKIAKEIKNLSIDKVLEVETDDPKAENDIEYFCNETGLEILKKFKENKILYFCLKKK